MSLDRSSRISEFLLKNNEKFDFELDSEETEFVREVIKYELSRIWNDMQMIGESCLLEDKNKDFAKYLKVISRIKLNFTSQNIQSCQIWRHLVDVISNCSKLYDYTSDLCKFVLNSTILLENIHHLESNYDDIYTIFKSLCNIGISENNVFHFQNYFTMFLFLNSYCKEYANVFVENVKDLNIWVFCVLNLSFERIDNLLQSGEIGVNFTSHHISNNAQQNVNLNEMNSCIPSVEGLITKRYTPEGSTPQISPKQDFPPLQACHEIKITFGHLNNFLKFLYSILTNLTEDGDFARLGLDSEISIILCKFFKRITQLYEVFINLTDIYGIYENVCGNFLFLFWKLEFCKSSFEFVCWKESTIRETNYFRIGNKFAAQYAGYNFSTILVFLKILQKTCFEHCAHLRISSKIVSESFASSKSVYTKNIVENKILIIVKLVYGFLGLVKSVELFRRYVRFQILPPIKSANERPEEEGNIKGYLVYLITACNDPNISNLIVEFLFVLCRQNKSKLVKHIGLGNAMGFLVFKGLFNKDDSGCYEHDSDDSDIYEDAETVALMNPVTASINYNNNETSLKISEEEKEREFQQLHLTLEKMQELNVIMPMEINEHGKIKEIDK